MELTLSFTSAPFSTILMHRASLFLFSITSIRLLLKPSASASSSASASACNSHSHFSSSKFYFPVQILCTSDPQMHILLCLHSPYFLSLPHASTPPFPIPSSWPLPPRWPLPLPSLSPLVQSVPWPPPQPPPATHTLTSPAQNFTSLFKFCVHLATSQTAFPAHKRPGDPAALLESLRATDAAAIAAPES